MQKFNEKDGIQRSQRSTILFFLLFQNTFLLIFVIKRENKFFSSGMSGVRRVCH